MELKLNNKCSLFEFNRWAKDNVNQILF